jgi:hypothetical protein
MADADVNDAIVDGCRRREPAIDFLSTMPTWRAFPIPMCWASGFAEVGLRITLIYGIQPNHAMAAAAGKALQSSVVEISGKRK